MRICKLCGREYPSDQETCDVDGSALVTVSIGGDRDPMVGQVLDGRFSIERRLGQGGMGTVYRAEQISMQRAVAVKIMQQHLSSDPTAVQRFFREARAASMLSHPNSITTYDFGQTSEGYLYIAMEFLDGVSLSSVLEEQKTLTFAEALEVIHQVCGSLTEAHEKGIVHRDLKPENVMLVSVEERRMVKVLDFGIAKLIDTGSSTVTKTGSLLGTPVYMSPEQSKGAKTGPKSDIYSIGIMFYEMLFGQTPFVGMSPLEIMVHKIERPELDLSSIVQDNVLPAPLVELLTKMTSPEPDPRPAAKDLQLEIERVMLELGTERLTVRVNPADASKVVASTAKSGGGLLGSVRLRTATFDREPVSKRKSWLGPVIAALVVLSLVAVYFVARRQKGSEPSSPPPSQVQNRERPQNVAPGPPTTPQRPLATAHPDVVTPAPSVVVKAPPTPVVKPKPLVPPKLAVRLVSKPAGAQILVGPEKKKVGLTPHLFHVPASKPEKRLALVLALDGYEREPIELQFDRSKDVVIVLKKVAPPPVAETKKKKRRTRIAKKSSKTKKHKGPRFSTNDLK
ncbi:MAG: serine/threonine protein kinase [Myxococcales bacterium]|nr:serine/threonine protein kinase [Myxococcales bacterium]